MPFIIPKPDNTLNIDYDRYTPVTVMAYWDMDGKITPVRFKYVLPDESVETYKIDNIKYIKDIKGGYLFRCYFTSYGRTKEIDLLFYIREHIWVMPIS